jgi:hypothetical protein
MAPPLAGGRQEGRHAAVTIATAWVLPETLAPFWAEALGYVVLRRNPPYVAMGHPAGTQPELLQQQVPEPKEGKDHMHLDLCVSALKVELGRMLGRGRPPPARAR